MKYGMTQGVTVKLVIKWEIVNQQSQNGELVN